MSELPPATVVEALYRRFRDQIGPEIAKGELEFFRVQMSELRWIAVAATVFFILLFIVALPFLILS